LIEGFAQAASIDLGFLIWLSQEAVFSYICRRGFTDQVVAIFYPRQRDRADQFYEVREGPNFVALIEGCDPCGCLAQVARRCQDVCLFFDLGDGYVSGKAYVGGRRGPV
jgi:hypothetical protein